MGARVWHELWSFTAEERQQSATLEKLTDGDVDVPGGLILTANDGGDEGWVSLPYEALRMLRDAIDEWLEAGGA